MIDAFGDELTTRSQPISASALRRFDSDLVDIAGLFADTQVTENRAEFLREAHEVEFAGTFTFEMCGHRDKRADGDYPGSAHTSNQQVVARVDRRDVRVGQGIAKCFQLILMCGCRLRSFDLAFNGYETRTEAVQAGVVLVAAVLVDLAFPPKLRFLRHHRQAIRFDRTVATAFTDEIIDHDELVRVFELAALATAPFLRGAGLRVDKHSDARYLAQFPLHAVEFAAVRNGRSCREIARAEELGFVGNNSDAIDALGAHRMGDTLHGQWAVDRLATRHCDRVVVQDLVSDVGAGGDRLPDRQRARMVERAIAEILEDVLTAIELRARNPVDAFAAHLDQAVCFAVPSSWP